MKSWSAIYSRSKSIDGQEFGKRNYVNPAFTDFEFTNPRQLPNVDRFVRLKW